MFLLFLIGLGTAHVNAQVRIGGNAAPNGAAVLDLNATDAATGTKGLALPRVNLTSNTMQITTGVANLNGMLVYNTTATLGTGIYFWSGSAWVTANLPATAPGDSGKILMNNGSSWIASWYYQFTDTTGQDTISLRSTPTPVSFVLTTDTNFWIPKLVINSSVRVPAPGVLENDLCFNAAPTKITHPGATPLANLGVTPRLGYMVVWDFVNRPLTAPNGYATRVRCYRASN